MNKKEELIKQLSFSLIDCPSDSWDKGYNSALKYVMNFVQRLDEPEITDEQAWNKIAEAYPESVQSLRNTLDNAVFSHKEEPKKVIVPRHVAEMIKIYQEKEISLAYLMKYFKEWYNKVHNDHMDSEAIIWIVNNLEDFVMAWVNGYEVEKEKSWVKRKPNVDSKYKHYLARFIKNNFEKPVFRHSGEEDPIIFNDKEKAAVIADWMKCTVELWED